MGMMKKKMAMIMECVMLVMGFLCHKRFTSPCTNTNWRPFFGSGGCSIKAWEASLLMTWGKNNAKVCTMMCLLNIA